MTATLERREPYVGRGAEGCLRSAKIDLEETDHLDKITDRERIAWLLDSAKRWERQALDEPDIFDDTELGQVTVPATLHDEGLSLEEYLAQNDLGGQPNVKLLEQTMGLIEALERRQVDAGGLAPNLWDQDNWHGDTYVYLPVPLGPTGSIKEEVCGTACCFAGWAVMLAGLGHQRARESQIIETRKPPVIGWDGLSYISIAKAAERILGLDGHVADDLFTAVNTADDLRRMVDEITELGTLRAYLDEEGDDD